MENRHKHLEMIQGIVTRMASHSFALKGWTVTLVASIFTLTGKDVEKVYFLVVYLPIIVFWGLDSYYLMQGRLFRALYDKVRELPPEKIDFSMRASPQEFNSKKNSFCSCFFSKTEIWFYLPLALISTGIIVVSCMQ